MNHHSGITRTATATTAAVDNISPFVAHGPLTILKVILSILTSTTASSNILIGNSSSASAYHGAINLKNLAAGLYEVDMTASTWVKTTLQKGDFLKVKANAAASGSCVFAGCFVFVPTSGQSDAATVG